MGHPERSSLPDHEYGVHEVRLVANSSLRRIDILKRDRNGAVRLVFDQGVNDPIRIAGTRSGTPNDACIDVDRIVHTNLDSAVCGSDGVLDAAVTALQLRREMDLNSAVRRNLARIPSSVLIAL